MRAFLLFLPLQFRKTIIETFITGRLIGAPGRLLGGRLIEVRLYLAARPV